MGIGISLVLAVFADRVHDYIQRDRARSQDGVLRADLVAGRIDAFVRVSEQMQVETIIIEVNS